MDIRVQDVQSRVQATDSQKLLDPRVMKQIIKACVEAVKEDQAREKRRAQDRELTSGVAPDRQ
jgi:DNA recombination-dependent growth factor C